MTETKERPPDKNFRKSVSVVEDGDKRYTNLELAKIKDQAFIQTTKYILDIMQNNEHDRNRRRSTVQIQQGTKRMSVINLDNKQVKFNIQNLELLQDTSTNKTGQMMSNKNKF